MTKNSNDLQKIISGIKALYEQIDEVSQSEEFAAFVDGITKTFSFIGTLIIPLKGIMPFVLAEMREKNLSFDDLSKEPEKKKLWREIVEGANQRAKAYEKARKILATGNLTVKQALDLQIEAEDVAAAIVANDKNEDTEKKMIRDMFTIDYLRNPLKAIEKWRTKENRDIWDTILDEARREQEQNQADQQEREEIILNSRYASAWNKLHIDKKQGKAALLARMAIIYFSATLPQDAPGIIEPGELTKAEGKKIKEDYKKIVSFEKEHPLKEQTEISFLLAFVKAENPAEGVQPKIIKRIEEAQDEDKRYSPQLQNKVSNALAHISSRQFKQVPHTNMEEAQHGGVIVRREIGKLPFSGQELKVLDAFVRAYTAKIPEEDRYNPQRIDEAREVELDMAGYMKLCGLSDPKKVRKQLNTAVDAIYDDSVQFKETLLKKDANGKIKKEGERLWKMRVFDAAGIESGKPAVKNNKVIVKLSFDFAKYLAASSLMQYPNALYKINTHTNPHSYFIGRKLAEHYNMNYFKTNRNIVGVMALIESCPDLPLYEEVMESGGQITQRIIKPFERDLMALKPMGVLSDWKYCNAKGEDITEEQCIKYDYETWTKWLVKFTLTEYPKREKKKIESKK